MSRVTVLMPVYNLQPYLKEAIDSILQQTYSDFELMILNDGSTDDSEKIIFSYTDPRIIYIKNEKNIGLVNTLNKGLQRINTEYIVRMDGDDISEQNRIEILVREMDKNPEVGVLSSYLKLFGDKTETWKMPLDNNDIKAGMIFNSTVAHAPCIIRTKILKEHSIEYSSAFPHMEDWDLWFRIMNITTFKGIPLILYHYRIFAHNVTVLNSHTMVERRKNFYRRIFSDFKWNVSEEEIDLHAAIGKSSFEKPDKQKLQACKKWLAKLQQLNQQDEKFPIKEFNALLKNKYDRLFYIAADKGYAFAYWRVFSNFKFSQLRYLLSKLLKR